MGNQLWIEDDELVQGSHPGCMSGILHALVDYHQWHSSVKKMIPYRKHNLLGHGKRDRHPRIKLIENDLFEVKNHLDDEVNQTHVDHKTKKSTSTNKRSVRVRIRALVSEQGHDKKGRVSRLKRTFSIHHLEPSADWGPPVIFLDKKADIGASKLVDYNQLAENHTGQEETPSKELVQEKKLRQIALDHEDNEYVDILEMFKVNEDMFHNVLQNKDGKQCLNTKARLTKSGSFPAGYSSNDQIFRPAKLENKQTEIYSSSKREELVSDARAPKLVSSKSGPLLTDGSAHEKNTRSFSHIRRISSLRESTDKYAQLFESSSSRLPKLQMSKSLTLINDNEIPISSHASLFFRRFLSFPHLEISSSACSQESEDENEPGGLPVITKQYIGIDYEEGPDYANSVVEKDEISPRAGYSACSTEGMHGMDHHKEQVEETSTEVQKNAVFIPGSGFQDEVKVIAEFNNSEGPVFRCNSFDKNESEVNSLDISITDILQQSRPNEQPEKFKSAKQCVKNSRCVKSSVEEDDDFIYVRDILELSGFIKNGLNKAWYSSDRPLDPCLFEELEYRYPDEPECFDEGITALFHHLVLFDLVDEVLFDLFERSYTYYPKVLSSSCYIHLVPIGDRFLDEFWANISRFLRFKTERKHSMYLNCAILQDLWKNDGWMNLQFDSEYLALELEGLILDELLGEIFCC